jgi:hypothetical protein
MNIITEMQDHIEQLEAQLQAPKGIPSIMATALPQPTSARYTHASPLLQHRATCLQN